MKTKTTDSKTLTFAVGTRSSMVAAEDVWFQRKRCNVVVPTGRRVGMRLNKPKLGDGTTLYTRHDVGGQNRYINLLCCGNVVPV